MSSNKSSRANSKSRPTSPVRNEEQSFVAPPSSINTPSQIETDPNSDTILELSAKLNDLALSLGRDHLVDLSQVRKSLETKSNSLDNRLLEQSNKINNISKCIQKEILDTEMNFCYVESIKPPEKFAEGPTLLDPKRLYDSCKVFPTREKFNGTSNIISFLEQVNYAQQVVALSEHEFREMLLRCFTRTPYLYLEEFIKNGMSTSDIYMSLISLYDSRLSPETAKADLSDLKCTKSKKYAKLIGEIMLLAGRAASILPNGSARSALYNVECNTALVKVLPTASSTLVSNQLNLLHAKLQRAPTFVELCKSIKPFTASIQKDISQYGTNDANTYKKFKPKVFSLMQNDSTENVSKISKKPNNYETKSIDGKPFKKDHRSYTGKNDNRSSKPKYCTLCGRTGHTAQDICFRMKTDLGKVVSVIPSYSPCKSCLQKNNVKLYHPQSMCFLRDSYPKRNSNVVRREKS